MDLARLLNPRTVAFVGGKWADIAARECRGLGFDGSIVTVNPRRAAAGEAGILASVDDLEDAPDAAFLAVPKAGAVDAAATLSRQGAGGFVMFASGFNETGAEDGRELLDRLLAESAGVPFTGPNCYGFINYFDRVSLWPDVIRPQAVDKGVAIISQSGTLAINLSHNLRSLPVGYVVSVGNQVRVTVEDLIEFMAQDTRVTAIGLYLEGITDAARFVEAVETARALGKPIALIKAGRTEAAAKAALTHTGSLSGSDAVFDAVCRRLGLARCSTLPELCETLKLLHQSGPLRNNRVLVVGASGGDMAMLSDIADDIALDLSPLPAATSDGLRALHGDRLVLSNPLDLNTYSWYAPDIMHSEMRLLSEAGYDALVYALDTPDPDNADPSTFVSAIDIFLEETSAAGQTACMMSSLPELTPSIVRDRVLEAGATPLQGLLEGLNALAGAARIGNAWQKARSLERLRATDHGTVLSETAAKSLLRQAGLGVPRGSECPIADAVTIADGIGYPVVVKASADGLAHKTEHNGVALNLGDRAAVDAAAARMSALGDRVLVEEMISDGVAEVLVGLAADPQFGLTLVVASGGTMTELHDDGATLLFPVFRDDVEAALDGLFVAPLIAGFRGRPGGDRDALIDFVMAIAAFAEARSGSIAGLDINPLIVRPAGRGVVAADILLHIKEETP